MQITCDDQEVAIGDYQGNIEIWGISPFRKLEVFKGHSEKVTAISISSDKSYMISGSYDQTIKFWNYKYQFLYGNIVVNGAIYSLYADEAAYLYVGLGNKLLSITNVITTNDLVIIGNHSFSLPFATHLQEIVKYPADPQKLSPEMLTWYIMPFGINLLHIFCYFENSTSTKWCMVNNCRFAYSFQRESPLTIAIKRQSFDCIEVIVKYSTKGNNNSGLYQVIEDDLVELHRANPISLATFYENAFITPKGSIVPVYGQLRSSPCCVVISPNLIINPSDFIAESHIAESKIEFRTTLFRVSSLLGSVSSIMFLQSLADCENKELFKTQFVQSFLTYKWNSVKKFLWFKSFLYFSLMISLLCLHFLKDYNSQVSFLVLLAINTVFLIFGIFQLLISFKNCYSNIWNVIDFITNFLIYLYLAETISIIDFLYISESMLVASLIFLVWVRGLSYFRVFSTTRYLIHMIIEIVKDVGSFVIILLYVTAGFSLIYSSLTNQAILACFAQVILIDFGDFGDFSDLSPSDENSPSRSTWIWFLIVSLINPLILLNMLIALMGDTYDRVQECQDVTDLKEMTSVIIECETMMFWRKNQGEQQYFQECREYSSSRSVQVEWQGRIKTIKKEIGSIMTSQIKQEREIGGKIDLITKDIEGLKEMSNFKIDSLERKIEIVTEKFKLRNK